MSDLLEQIGITKEELINRIVDKALGITADYKQTGEESWDDIPLSKVVDKKIEVAMGNMVEKMSGKIHDRIDRIMDAKIEEIFTTPFQRTDKWGAKIGEPTAIRDSIYADATSYWTTKVDNQGKPSSGGYGDTTVERSVFYARKVMTEVYDKELVKTVKEMADDLKKKIPATIAKEISDAVVKHLR